MAQFGAEMNVLDLFSGIGGFSLGLERAGMRTVALCEIDPFARRVLAKHWPTVPCYDDVRNLSADTLRRDGISVDVICGGFPCQDISKVGNQAGMGAGTRSGLWSEIARLSSELRPKFIIVENVSALLIGPPDKPGAWFGRVLGDLAALGYDAEWHCIPASAVGAPHPRDRAWVVAYPAGQYEHDHIVRKRDILRSSQTPIWGLFDRAGARMVDGISDRPHRIKTLGNAVVPQIPEIIGRAIMNSIHPTTKGNT